MLHVSRDELAKPRPVVLLSAERFVPPLSVVRPQRGNDCWGLEYADFSSPNDASRHACASPPQLCV